MEREKVNECLKAWEREKIAKGMQCTRHDEIRLREMHKLQMYEKKCIIQEEENQEDMWHQILIEDVKRKEEFERRYAENRQREMIDRRRAYDEQIASANKKRRDALREEREKEKRKFERIREKMERDHYEELKSKREKQLTNRTNFIHGHELKVNQQAEAKRIERELDNKHIQKALEELRAERQKKRNEMLQLRKDEETFKQAFNIERKISEQLEMESDMAAQEYKQEEENKTDEYLRQIDCEKKINKEKAIQEYRRHLDRLKENIEMERIERKEAMHRVSRTAHRELQMKLNSANEELRRQIEYRNMLTNQIQDNQRVLESQIINNDEEDWPFTKKSQMFADIMLDRYKQYSIRKSTNPVHPFKRIMNTEDYKENTVHLPIIGTKYKL